jgi:hypothetical protein
MTIKQTELIDAFKSQINDEERQFIEPIIGYLLDLGYIPRRHSKTTFAVEFVKYGRLISKYGNREGQTAEILVKILRRR